MATAGTRSDATLLAAARSDPRAFRELYDRYAERVHGYHLRRSRDRDAAHDLTAETFAQAWLARARFRDEAGGSAGPWLFGIARHVLLASVRRAPWSAGRASASGVLERLGREPAAAEPRRALARRARRGARRPARDAARGRAPARAGRPRVRRRGRPAGHDAPRCPGPRLARPRHSPPQAVRGGRPMSDVRSTLDHLGDALEDAPPPTCTARGAARPAPPRRWRGHAPLVLAARRCVVIPGVALAADRLIVDEEESPRACPPARWRWPAPNPTCTVVQENVEYHCVLAKAPAPEVEDWKGTVEPTVDATSHINGGCRSLSSRRHRVAVLHRPGGRRPADHRPGVPGRVLVRAGRGLARTDARLRTGWRVEKAADADGLEDERSQL